MSAGTTAAAVLGALGAVGCGVVTLFVIGGTVSHAALRTRGPSTAERAPVDEPDAVDQHLAEAALDPDHPVVAEATEYLREQAQEPGRRSIWGPFTTGPEQPGMAIYPRRQDGGQR